MTEISFEATGTKWAILIDEDVGVSVEQELKAEVMRFEMLYSRFRKDSEIGRINALELNENEAREYKVSAELLEMLSFGKDLQDLTKGRFDINVASILEGHGYDASYSFERDEGKLGRRRGTWTVWKDEIDEGGILKLSGFVKLDLGAYGKGKLIDLLVEKLQSLGIDNFLVDGGRDFWGTSKRNGDGWKIALEHPFDSAAAIGVLELKNSALACSGISQRKVRDFHHFMDTDSGNPLKDPVGVFVRAQTAMDADGISTAMVVGERADIDKLSAIHEFDFVVVNRRGNLQQRGFDKVLF